jgi:1-deoxy-D-xylulose-5-phosphate synthase
MLGLLRTAVAHQGGPFSIRWPRDAVPAEVPPIAEIEAVPYGTWEILRRGRGLAILAVGTMVLPALDAASELSARGIEATVVSCRFLKPYDRAVFEDVAAGHEAILTVEEGTLVNGFGSFMARELDAFRPGGTVCVDALGIPDRFVPHGSRSELLADAGLDAAGITARARALAEAAGLDGTARESA